ncbi:MAG: tRNA (N6-threonylcarbamoyladenosine(37)-N6)-methyltransferase TrmO [Candidatus Bathyarchaeota archaeon]|jgi:tRNA-Thr(GGU) m(6)t(6)A37 methyltransferase TsaA
MVLLNILRQRLAELRKRISNMEKIELEPIGFVSTNAVEKEVRHRKHISSIILREDLTETLDGIEDFSHLFVFFWMHRIPTKQKRVLKVHPRGRDDMPLVGTFATRTPYRPNPIGLTIVELLNVDKNILSVRGLDAFDNTPVLDIKPFDYWDTDQDAKVPEWWKRLKREPER